MYDIKWIRENRDIFDAGRKRRGLEPLADGGMRISVIVDDRARFRGWLLGLGTHAEVEGPPELRAHVREWLEAAGAEEAAFTVSEEVVTV